MLQRRTRVYNSYSYSFSYQFYCFTRRGPHYKTGVAIVKKDSHGNWLKTSTKDAHSTMRHVFISHPVDDKHAFIAFVTSQPFISLPYEGRIENFRCLDVANGERICKFINYPILVNLQQMTNYIEIREGGAYIEEIFSVHLQGSMAVAVATELWSNFVSSLLYTPTYDIVGNPSNVRVKILAVKEEGNFLTGERHLKLTIETKCANFIIDEQNTVYSQKTFILPMTKMWTWCSLLQIIRIF